MLNSGINDLDALVVVDMQNDFMPCGSMGVREADRIVPVINDCAALFSTRVFTRDWHPAGHISFSSNPQYLDYSWPEHCVQDTFGAQFAPELNILDLDHIINKGSDPHLECYSGFAYSALAEWLNARKIQRVFVCGVATDYCVKATAQDSVNAGFMTFVISDAVRAVNEPDGAVQAIEEMKKIGIHIISSRELPALGIS